MLTQGIFLCICNQMSLVSSRVATYVCAHEHGCEPIHTPVKQKLRCHEAVLCQKEKQIPLRRKPRWRECKAHLA